MSVSYVTTTYQPHHVIKCVVVGDSGVGKTRLVCTRGSGTKYQLHQLLHSIDVPTVWAIDHYRKDPKVLEHSQCTVDGVNVSLRLWDTFGTHDKDRRFCYQRSDVIMLCFSLVRPRSLRTVKTHWTREIKRLCNDVPVVLVGCQADLRYLYDDPSFKAIDKGMFFKEITKDDIVTPEAGRAVAKEIGAMYYETSVLDTSCLDDVFINVIRAGLIAKRGRHIWGPLGNYKNVLNPQAQKPLNHPKPFIPPCVVPAATDDTYLSLLTSHPFCDVIFVVQGVRIEAHAAFLAAAHPVFEELFRKIFDYSSVVNTNDDNNREYLSVQHGNCFDNQGLDISASSDAFNDSVNLSTDNSSITTDNVIIATNNIAKTTPLHHSVFVSFKNMIIEEGTVASLVSVCDNITPRAFQNVLMYLYTGMCTVVEEDIIKETKKAAELLGLTDLILCISNIETEEEFLNVQLKQNHLDTLQERIKSLLINDNFMTDVVFDVDDGQVAAHKALIMANCDVMTGMFSHNFMESSQHTILFPGVGTNTFRVLQHYLYTSDLPSITNDECLDLIELANRVCLPQMVAMVEEVMIRQLNKMPVNPDLYEDVLMLLEPSQLHNAGQLAEWCRWFICCNYSDICRTHGKLVSKLLPENKVYISQHQWPPLWHLKELDYYERCVIDQEREKMKIKSYLARKLDGVESSCLCFCGNRSRNRNMASAIQA